MICHNSPLLATVYISFCLQTGTMAPVVLGQKKYGLRDQCSKADCAPTTLSLQVNVWDKTIMWWMRHTRQPMVISKVDSLYKYGYSYMVKGFQNRPGLANATMVGEQLWHYFHPEGSGRTVRSLSRPWCVQRGVPHAAFGD